MATMAGVRALDPRAGPASRTLKLSSASSEKGVSASMGVLTTCQPRPEVLIGELDDAIFAADFGDLIAGNARPVYQDPAKFFRNTHPAKALTAVISAVFDRLADGEQPGRLIRLSTGFGGGKTHTLMALWHLAMKIDDPALGDALLPAAGRPTRVSVAAIDASKAGTPLFAVHGKDRPRSLWGEIAWQLGGSAALAQLGPADDPEANPTEQEFESLFPDGPVLVLLDELVVYMASLTTQGQGNLKAILTKLASIASHRPQTVVVVTDPADQRAYADQAGQLGLHLAEVEAAIALDDIIGRKASDFDPIGDESAQVIITRLFDAVDTEAAAATAADYASLYARVNADLAGSVPLEALSAEYQAKIKQSYPFHPRLLATASDRLGALQEFNKSRGTLRLFARIIRTVWDRGDDLSLITAGELDWSSPLVQGDLLFRLNRDTFTAAVSADVIGHAGELDTEWATDAHGRAASALLLESIPLNESSGLSTQEMTLAILRPSEAGNEPGEALDRLMGVCWHTYPLPGGGAQFRFEPNVIKQIEQELVKVPLEDGRSRVQTTVQSFFRGAKFKLVSWPTVPAQVPELADLQLALCATEEIARNVTAFDAPDQPRRLRNAIVAVAASGAKLDDAVHRARRLIVAETILSSAKDKSTRSKLIRDQLGSLIPTYARQLNLAAFRAFDRIVLASGDAYSMEETYLADDAAILAGPEGQAAVGRFLEDKKLLYKATDALDVDRFMEILTGATPNADGSYTGKAVHERLLAAQGLRLIADVATVRATVKRAVEADRIVLQLADGTAFRGGNKTSGPDGARRQSPGSPEAFSMDNATLIVPADSELAALWIATDDPQKKTGEDKPPLEPTPPPPPAGKRRTDTWDGTIDAAGSRPLEQLTLTASTPADAQTLAGLAAPMSASSVTLAITVSGALRGGGDIKLLFNGVPLKSPLKPVEVATTMATAAENPAFEVRMTLEFVPTRVGAAHSLGEIRTNAASGIKVQATFASDV